MRVLFLGGTGIISTACVQLALRRGFQVTLLNRGKRNSSIKGVEFLVADLHDEAAAAAAIGSREWDVVANFIGFKAEDIERDLRLFRGRMGQYLYISSASAYQKPVGHYLISESTPLANPFWEYSRDKIACEERLMKAYREEQFPVTLVRPSLTYGDTQVALCVNSWERSYTAVDRMRRGVPVIIPGDGTSLWTMTHNSDFAKGFVGLFGNPQTLGHAFHITSDEVQTWNQFYAQVAEAAGVKNPKFLHIASDCLAACLPELRGGLLGDKAHSVVFDNGKIKAFVPDFVATTPFHLGIESTIAWFDADPSRRVVDQPANEKWDRVISWYERTLAAGAGF